MQIINKYSVNIFKNTYNDRDYYKVGISKKGSDGKYIDGTMDCQFRKDVKVDSTKKIYIKEAWLDFYLTEEKKNDKTYTITHPYIFINKFEYVGEVIEESKVANDPLENNGSVYLDEIELDNSDLPF